MLGLLICSADATAQEPTCRPSRINTSKCDIQHGLGIFNGTYLEGTGLETLHFKPVGGHDTFPPAGLSRLTSSRACGSASAVSVVVNGCTAVPDPKHKRAAFKGAAFCTVHVLSKNGICATLGTPRGHMDATLMAVQGFWDGSGAWHNDPDTITLACNEQDADGPMGSVNSAIGTCVNGGYSPSSDAPAFLACIRAVRADYCGDGTPHTRQFTAINLHDVGPINPMTPDQCEDGKYYEATWSADGAVCLYHDRWTGKGMSDEKCPGGKATVGAPCASSAGVVVSTRSGCDVCSSWKGAVPVCSPDEDPVCVKASANGGAH